jgi:diamine N-acetyltransferase
MVDERYQGQGYGKAAIQAVIARIGHELDGNEVLIAYCDDNHAARQLYAELGFVEKIKERSGRVIALLKQVKSDQ